jgi:hypothetical protein
MFIESEQKEVIKPRKRRLKTKKINDETDCNQLKKTSLIYYKNDTNGFC